MSTLEMSDGSLFKRNFLLVVVATLVTIGLIMVTSASMDVAERRYDDAYYFAKRHGIYLLVALTAGSVTYMVSTGIWRKTGAALLVFAYILLILVLIPGIGNTVKGSTRWISMGSFTIQVSEIAKVCVLVYLSGYLVRRGNELQQSFWGFVKPILVLSVLVVLLLLEPDFGSVVVIMTAVFAMLFLAGVKFSQFALVILSSGLAGYLLIATSEYRMRRLQGFFNPFDDQYSSGYQLVQSLIAFGRGDLTGVGLGNGIQKLYYLPEAHTDFIFAIIAEETGLLGSLGVLGLFLLLIMTVFLVGRKAETLGALFNAYLAYGIAVMLGIQAFINIGVCCGLLPTKGLTLPLVSYGGSSLVINAVIVGIVLRIAKENHLMAVGELDVPALPSDVTKHTPKKRTPTKSKSTQSKARKPRAKLASASARMGVSP